VRLATLPPSVSQLSRKMREPRRSKTLWASTACYKDSFTFLSCGLGVELNVPHHKRTVCYMTTGRIALNLRKSSLSTTDVFHIHGYVVESET
jgi:hypothetical protein